MSEEHLTYPELHQRFQPVLQAIAEGAIERDRDRRLPHQEVRALAAAGFTAVSVPMAHGGAGADVRTLLRLLIDLGEADSNLPQLLRAHFAFVNDLLLGAVDVVEDEPTEAAAAWFDRLAGGAVFGNASHERSSATVGDLATTVMPTGEGYRVVGEKHYSTGSIFADWILVTARTPDGRRARVIVGIDDPGVETRDDWDGFGQTLTGSGSTLLQDVLVPASRVRIVEGLHDGASTTQTAFLQLVLLASLVGVGRAALRDGIAFVRSRTRVYSQGSGASAAEDPLVQQVIGRLSARVAAAEAAVDAAAAALQMAQDAAAQARRAGGAEATAEDGRNGTRLRQLIDAAELRTVQAQITVVQEILTVTTELFEVGGASATSRGRALDRHWRNARTLASHNPVIYQERAIGDRLLNGTDLLYFWATGEKPAAASARSGSEQATAPIRT